MALFSGKDGGVTYANGYSTKVVSWTVDAEAEEVDTTALGENWASWLPGVKSWSGTYEALVDDSVLDTSGTVGGVSAFALGATAASATFEWDSDGTKSEGVTGSIIITGASPTATTGGTASRIVFRFRGTGTLSTTTA